MILSIIIINFNTKDLLLQCLESIFNKVKIVNYEIIIVDNNSKDSSIEAVKALHNDRIKIFCNEKNLGFGAANNLGVKQAVGEFLFLLNSDTILTENFIDDAISIFKQDIKIGIWAPKLMLDDVNEQKSAFGKFPNVINSIIKPLNKIKTSNKDLVEVDWVSGAAMLIRKDTFEKIGGFDQKYFMYFEDTDLCYQLKRRAFKIVVSRKYSLIHLGGKSLSGNLSRKKYYYNSQDYFFKKNYGQLVCNLMKMLRFPYRSIKLKLDKI